MSYSEFLESVSVNGLFARKAAEAAIPVSAAPSVPVALLSNTCTTSEAEITPPAAITPASTNAASTLSDR